MHGSRTAPCDLHCRGVFVILVVVVVGGGGGGTIPLALVDLSKALRHKRIFATPSTHTSPATASTLCHGQGHSALHLNPLSLAALGVGPLSAASASGLESQSRILMFAMANARSRCAAYAGS